MYQVGYKLYTTPVSGRLYPRFYDPAVFLGLWKRVGLYLLVEVIQFLHFKTPEIKLLTFYYNVQKLISLNLHAILEI